MNWNKEIIKGPGPVWTIIVCAIFNSCFFCWLINNASRFERETALIISYFALGVLGCIYARLLTDLSDNVIQNNGYDSFGLNR